MLKMKQELIECTYTKKEKKHNGIISIWKFLFAIMVVLRHIEASNTYFENYKYTFIAGSIAVDFFFIVSGYLMTKKAMSKDVKKEELGTETYDYIAKKVKAFFPYVLTAIIITIITKIFMSHKISTPNLVNYIFDIMMIPMLLIRHARILGIEWYISAMLLGMMILYPLILKHKKNFLYIIAPLVSLFILGFISRMDGSLAGVDIYYFGYLPKGLIRAAAVLCLGSITYLITEKITQYDYTFFAKIILTIIEVMGLASIFYIVNVPGAHEKYGFIMLMIFVISIAVAFSEKSLSFNICNNKLFYYLEKISLPVYLNHMWVIDLLNFMLGKQEVNYYVMSLIVICFTVVASIILTYMIEKIQNSNKLKQMIRNIFLKTKLGEDKNVEEQA